MSDEEIWLCPQELIYKVYHDAHILFMCDRSMSMNPLFFFNSPAMEKDAGQKPRTGFSDRKKWIQLRTYVVAPSLS